MARWKEQGEERSGRVGNGKDEQIKSGGEKRVDRRKRHCWAGKSEWKEQSLNCGRENGWVEEKG